MVPSSSYLPKLTTRHQEPHAVRAIFQEGSLGGPGSNWNQSLHGPLLLWTGTTPRVLVIVTTTRSQNRHETPGSMAVHHTPDSHHPCLCCKQIDTNKRLNSSMGDYNCGFFRRQNCRGTLLVHCHSGIGKGCTHLDDAMPPRMERPEIHVPLMDIMRPEHLPQRTQPKREDALQGSLQHNSVTGFNTM